VFQSVLVLLYSSSSSKYQINAGKHGNKTFGISVNPTCVSLPGYSTPTRAIALLNMES